MYVIAYECNHTVYDVCTLYKIGNKRLCVIQQRFNNNTKSTFLSEIDPWLTDILYFHPKFKSYFDKRSGEYIDRLYPTVTIRQIMLALKNKTIHIDRWETCFDRREVKIREIFTLYYGKI